MVILEIFASRARTSEAKLQVELARSKYALSHVVRGAAASYDQQRGGVGFIFGGGEKALELRRRDLRDHIKALQDKLKGSSSSTGNTWACG
jgi:GTPase